MLVIYGPTATGKTDLAIKLAKKLNGELISADSRQVYKGLDIGTGKVSFESQVIKGNGYWIVDGVKIHGFDLVDPGEQFTAADFVKFANSSIIQKLAENKLPIIVGGTAFYIKSQLDGIGSSGIGANPKLRQKLEKLSTSQLFQKLLMLDPKRALKMNDSDRKNPRRLVRAIEIASSSLPTSDVSTDTSWHTSEVKKDCLIIGLTAPNEYLYQKVDKWLDTRMDHGLEKEISALIEKGVNQKWLDNLGLEYRWLSRYLLKKVSKEEAIERLKGDIHNFIRRQKTWFNKFPNIKLFDISSKNWRDKLEKTVEVCYTQSK